MKNLIEQLRNHPQARDFDQSILDIPENLIQSLDEKQKGGES